MTNWILAYLLFGFVVSWIGSNVMLMESSNGWRWELAATVLWPITIILCLIAFSIRRRARRSGLSVNG